VPPAVEGPSREERWVAWAKANQNYLAIGLGAVAVVVLATWFLSVSAKRKANFARVQLEQAWGSADAGNLPLASSEFQKVASTYAGTEAANEAVLSLNQARLLSGQSQLAADDLRKFLGSNPPARYASQAGMLLGAALENVAKGVEAAQAYEQASVSAEADFAKAEALLASARAYRSAGKQDQAVAALRTILEKYKETASYPVAEIRLAEITKGS
jgi:outer membrane protein assembly factor BamD (BamD/ComL family)